MRRIGFSIFLILFTSCTVFGEPIPKKLLAGLPPSAGGSLRILVTTDSPQCLSCIKADLDIVEIVAASDTSISVSYGLVVARLREYTGRWARYEKWFPRGFPVLTADLGPLQQHGLYVVDSLGEIVHSIDLDTHPPAILETALSDYLARSKRRTVHITGGFTLHADSTTGAFYSADINADGHLVVIHSAPPAVHVYSRDDGRFIHGLVVPDSVLNSVRDPGTEIIEPADYPIAGHPELSDACLYDGHRYALSGTSRALEKAAKANTHISRPRAFYIIYDPRANRIDTIVGFNTISRELDKVKHPTSFLLEPGRMVLGRIIKDQLIRRGDTSDLLHEVDLKRGSKRSSYKAGPAQRRANLLGNLLNVYLVRMNDAIYAMQLLEDSLYDSGRQRKYPLAGYPFRSVIEQLQPFDYTSDITDDEWRVEMIRNLPIARFTPGLARLGEHLLGVKYQENQGSRPTGAFLLLFDTQSRRRVGYVHNKWSNILYDARTGEFGGFRKEGEDLIFESMEVLPK